MLRRRCEPEDGNVCEVASEISMITIYLASALVLAGIFLAYAISLYYRYSDWLARATFRYSIVYLALLFAALLTDHYLLIAT